MHNEQDPHQCSFKGVTGDRCKAKANSSGYFCFWHDPKVSKEGMNVNKDLQDWVARGYSLEGFILRGADLSHLKLGKSHRGPFINFMGADLYHANLSDAHLFAVNFAGASLMKANLQGANINRSNMSNVNLLGSKLKNAKIEGISWGKKAFQESQAMECLKQKDSKSARKWFTEAEEVYRNLYKECETRGLYHEAGHFFYREQIMRRYLMAKGSLARQVSWWVDILCGYGEKPWRIIFFSSSFILVCTLLFGLGTIQSPEGPLSFFLVTSGMEFCKTFLNLLYFSVVTFTTLGYGDMTPLGFARLIAAIEAFVGAFALALFVVAFVKKMTR